MDKKFGDHRSADPFGGIRVKRVAAKPPEPKLTREELKRRTELFLANEEQRWILQGWGGYRPVSIVTRGSQALDKIPASERRNYIIEIRPKVGEGIFERPKVIRAVPRKQEK